MRHGISASIAAKIGCPNDWPPLPILLAIDPTGRLPASTSTFAMPPNLSRRFVDGRFAGRVYETWELSLCKVAGDALPAAIERAAA
jgi:hypothetical protein